MARFTCVNQEFDLLAHADHVTTGSKAPLTGTSVATAFVSAEAARVWSELPTWTADEVMDEVWTRAAPTVIDTTGPYAGPGFFGSTTARRVASCNVPDSVPSPSWPTVQATSVVVDGTDVDPFANIAPTGGYLPFATPTPTGTACPSCDFLVPLKTLSYDISAFSPTGSVRFAIYSSTERGARADQVFDLGMSTSGIVRFDNTVAVPQRAALLFPGMMEGENVSYIAEVSILERDSEQVLTR